MTVHAWLGQGSKSWGRLRTVWNTRKFGTLSSRVTLARTVGVTVAVSAMTGTEPTRRLRRFPISK